MPQQRPPDFNWHSFIESLKLESQSRRSLQEGTWDRNLKRYLGDHWDTNAPDGLKQFVDNRIQTSVLASVAVQTEQRPRVRITPSETNESPIIYLADTGVQKLATISAPIPITREQAAGQQAISEAQAEALAITPARSAETDLETGEPALQPLFTVDDFVVITDQTAAEATQSIVDHWWEVTGADYLWTENILNKGVLGHQPMLVQWNDKTLQPELSNEHVLNVWIDPTATGMKDADYIIFEMFLSQEEATAMFPQWAEVIRAESNDSSDIRSSAQTLGGPFRDTTFQREMVTIKHAWLKHEAFPVDPEVLIRGGDLIPVSVDGVHTGEFALAATGDLTNPDAPNYPQESGIRQLIFIGDRLVDNFRSNFRDLPWAWNINIPKPYSPYGQGEPERLEDLQKAINMVLSHLHNNLKYFAQPQQFFPASVIKQVKNLDKMHSHPKRTIPVPDHLWERFMQRGPKALVHDPPSPPALFLQFLTLLLQEADNTGGNVQVLQGRTDSRAESGKAIQALQSAARGVIGFKSIYTEQAIQQKIRLWVAFIHDFLPESEWVKIVGGQPLPVLRSIRDRSKRLVYDVKVEVVSGRGTNRQVEEDRAMIQFQNGLRSRLSTMEALGIPDVKNEYQKVLAEQAAIVAAEQETQTESAG